MAIDAISRPGGVSLVGMGDPAQAMPTGKEAVAVNANKGDGNRKQDDVTAAATLEDLEQATLVLEDTVQAFNQRLSFVLHEESGRMQVQVIDNKTQEVVKELPPTEILEVVARIRQMVGLLLDKKV
ncbi:MAG TPA: flagellar protein FlaG [Firmicutes bacterium]|nr:flagellar protein FlaG [Bacillota bacterium]